MKKIRISLLFLLTLTCLPVTIARIPAGQIRQLNSDWLFLRSDLGSIWEAVRPSAPESPETLPVWESVTLPHCVNATDGVDPKGNYYQGVSWYKTLISCENPYKNGRTILHFEGVGQESDVYIYTTKLAHHTGGYDEWEVDITDAVEKFINTDICKKQFKGKIPLSIRVDNSRNTERIPSSMSDFNIYGGIYRHLNLVYQPAVSFQKPTIEPTVILPYQGKGKLSVNIPVKKSGDFEQFEISIRINDPDGKVVAQKSQSCHQSTEIFNHIFDFNIKKPLLWSPDSPLLYACVITVKSDAGEMSYSEKVGFRYFEFQDKGPFIFNGKRLLLKGTHRHEDHAGVGAAMSDDQIIAEMQLIKDMGVNFIRLGHYPQSELVLDLCDELGIIVWEEIPWCRGGLGGDEYQELARQMLKNMIGQHRNHPSIVIWGMGNENDWAGDFEKFDTQKIRVFMKELHDLSHQLDSTRVTSIRRCDFCKDIIDVYSPSIWAGWYRGVYTDYLKVSENEMKKVNHFLHVEWGGDSHAGRHSEHPTYGLDGVNPSKTADERPGDATLKGGSPRVSKDGDWSESYICELFDWHLKEQEKMPWLTGTAFWVFKDFATPLRPENPIPFVNQKGVVQRDLTPKESYYVFQSYWAQKPMVHIYGHSWPVRWGLPGETKLIKVFSNCEQAELFLNGISQGVKKRNSQDFPAAGLRWHVVYREGDNQIRVIAKKGKVTLTDEITQLYQTQKWGSVEKISLKTKLIDNNEIMIEATLRDKNGVLCADARDFIEFDLTGDDELVVNQGTVTGSRKIQARNGRATIRVKISKGNSIVSVATEKANREFITLKDNK